MTPTCQEVQGDTSSSRRGESIPCGGCRGNPQKVGIHLVVITHIPRPLKTGWSKGPDGHWVSRGVKAHSWEVICEECGDIDGPVETQSEAVRVRRGPYSSKHKAEHAATEHFKETQ